MRRRIRSWVAGLLPLALCLGCASSRGPEREQEQKRARSHFNLGVDHLSNGRPALALRELLAAEKIEPSDARVHYALAEAYLAKHHFAEAEAHLLETLALSPDYHDARISLSGLYIHLDRHADAIAQSEILLQDPTFPAPWRALTNRGWADFKLGHLGEARRHLELAHEYNRRYWPALLNLGILAREEGRRTEAARLFEAILELQPGPRPTAEANYHLGEIYVSLGERERATAHFRRGVALDPGGEWGERSEESLKLLR